jgi:two-component system sensor histidine kinase DegS
MSNQEAEKKSLAEDIHDESLQALATCLYKVDLACRLSELNEPERLLAELHGLRASLAESIDRLGNLIFDLRPPTLDTLGLLPTLDAALHRLEDETGAKTLLQSVIGQRLSPALETTIYRLVQGALDNVRRHARASAVLVGLRRVGDMVRVVVEDNGVGFSPEQTFGDALQTGRVGLAAMRERVELVGGCFEVDSSLGDGTRVIFALPFQGRDREP